MAAIRDDDKDKTLIRLLVAMAWADGRVDTEETRVVEAMIESFGVDKEVEEELLSWAKSPRSLNDVDTSNLSVDDAELALHQSVILSFVDGEQSEKEVQLLLDLSRKLGLSKDVAAKVVERATTHAKSLLPVLQA
jgi:uncharacterized membrane protein YebE (DUF533 family)